MKKHLSIFAIILISIVTKAQDTLDIDYDKYMFNDKPDSGIDASVKWVYDSYGEHANIVDTLGGFGNGQECTDYNGIIIQRYHTEDSIKVYGVALLFSYRIYGSISQDVSKEKTRYRAMMLEGDDFIAGKSRTLNPVDSVWFDTASAIRRCRFRYDGELPEAHSAVVPCVEFYFDKPQSVYGDFFVGRSYAQGDYKEGSNKGRFYVMEHFGRYNHSWTPYNFAFKQFPRSKVSVLIHPDNANYNHFCWWKPDDFSGDFFNHAATHDNLWGFCFPIIGLRCQPMRALQVEEQGEQYVNFGWQAGGEEGGEYVVSLYDTVNQAEVATDTIADTNYMFSSLTPSIYRFSVKKNCHYVTTGYDTTVWSDASTLLVTMGGYEPPVDTTAADTTIVDTTGIRLAAVGDADFSLRPNPAVAAAVVTLQYAVAEVAELQLVDLHGRTVQHHVLSAGTKQLTLDLAQLPAGAYLVKLVTPRGLSARRLVVRK